MAVADHVTWSENRDGQWPRHDPLREPRPSRIAYVVATKPSNVPPHVRTKHETIAAC